MSESMNVVDAVSLAVSAAVSEVPQLPMTPARIEVPAAGDRVTRVTVSVDVIGPRKRHPISIHVDVEDGRVLEAVTSLKQRLLAEIDRVVGLRAD